MTKPQLPAPGHPFRKFGACMAGLMIAVLLGASALVFTLHLGLKPVLSGSMRPAFAPGSMVVTEPIPVAQLRPGMVVVFTPPGQKTSYAHRIVSVSGSASHPVIRTKGDANPAPDPWQMKLQTATVPRVIFSVPYVGWLSVWVRDHLVALLIAVVGLIVAVTGTRSILHGAKTVPVDAATGGRLTVTSPRSVVPTPLPTRTRACARRRRLGQGHFQKGTTQ